MPSFRGSSKPRDQTCVSYVSCNGKWVLNHWCHLGTLVPTPRDPLVCFLSLDISLHFMEVYSNGIIQDVLLFCYLLLFIIIILTFIHIVVSIVPCFSIAE